MGITDLYNVFLSSVELPCSSAGLDRRSIRRPEESGTETARREFQRCILASPGFSWTSRADPQYFTSLERVENLFQCSFRCSVLKKSYKGLVVPLYAFLNGYLQGPLYALFEWLPLLF
jgi:hypothetical protein